MFPHRDVDIALHEPRFNTQAEKLVLECLRSTYVSSVGEYVRQFEAKLAAACGVKYAVAMVNGTAALEVALRVVGVEPGSEVGASSDATGSPLDAVQRRLAALRGGRVEEQAQRQAHRRRDKETG